MSDPTKKFAVRDYEVMLRPHVSEKTITLATKGVYTFEVHPDANKLSVKLAFFNIFGKMPQKVTISNYQGKTVRTGRTQGTRASWKKATISLPKGETINDLSYA
ncbi:MAG: 50S ribosomal protein L23 [bacterium]|nr:50S ribosomal protein L23 [bacterium]